PWDYFSNESSVPFFHTEGFHQFRSHLLDAHAEPPAGYMSLLLKLGSNLFGHVDRDRESNALSRGDDRCIDTHDLAFRVDKRATAAARVDRGSGLTESVIR